METNEFPMVQMIAIKHDFGEGRYMTLMVTRFPKHVVASMFGTEHGQIDLKAGDIMDGRRILEAEFAQLFPAHTCEAGCHATWHPLGDLPEPQVVQ